MTIIVTGAAGFIGANIVQALNARGEKNIIAVDDLQPADKYRNLADLDIIDYLDKAEFLEAFRSGRFGKVKAVFHEGACSDTMETDGIFMMANNYRYTMDLLDVCTDQKVQLLYASSAATYGGSDVFVESREHEKPLNIYGYSKFLFDQVMRKRFAENANTAQVVGFRYFNVYGMDEKKDDFCTSPVYRFSEQAKSTGVIKIFEGSEKTYRDFVCVDDVVQLTTRKYNEHGVYDLGCGTSISFLDVAVMVADKYKATIQFIPFPEVIKGKYQKYSIAQNHLPDHKFTQVEEFVQRMDPGYSAHLLI